MTKQEALQLFASHVNVPALKASFPDIDWVVTELEDGQQEIIIRLQGEDKDFRPDADYAAISVLQIDDIPDEIKNLITLRKRQRVLTRARRARLENAILKRIKSLIVPTGVSLLMLIGIIADNIPVEEEV